jgi:hypothetical protein
MGLLDKMSQWNMHGQVKILAGLPGSGKTERLIAAYRAFLKDRQTELKDRQTEGVDS